MAYIIANFPGGTLSSTKFVLDESDSLSIGRSPENHITEGGHGLSRRHALITYYDKIPVLRDLGSSNGTYVNGKAITRPIILMNSDRIVCGELELRYYDDDDDDDDE